MLERLRGRVGYDFVSFRLPLGCPYMTTYLEYTPKIVAPINDTLYSRRWGFSFSLTFIDSQERDLRLHVS